jgi:hypothetical protein
MFIAFINGWSDFACIKRYLEDINQLLRGKVLRGIYSRIYNA